MGYLRDNEDFCFEIVKWESIYVKDFLSQVVRNPSKAQRLLQMNLVLWRNDLENATSDEDEWDTLRDCSEEILQNLQGLYTLAAS